jgi:hypothetical protein
MLPASVAVRFLRDPIRYRPVAELAPARLFVAWPREPESAEVASFVRAAKKVAGTEAEVETPRGVETEMSASASTTARPSTSAVGQPT